MAAGRLGAVLGGAALAAAAAGGAWWWSSARERQLELSSLVAGFERRNELTVFAAQVVPVVTSVDEGLIDALDVRQTAIIPAEVRYTIDMGGIGAEDLRWDAERSILEVTAPPVLVQRPNLREERAQYYRSGLPFTGGQAAAALLQRSSRAAMGEAGRLARSPELVRLANEAARDAVARNAELFLRGAGMEGARVEVRFAAEGRRSPERVDGSRSLNEVWEERAR